MEYRGGFNESGALYIVPNKHGPGKTIIRRPHPPPTSPPLDDDFDAFTQAPTTARGLEPSWDDSSNKAPCTPTASQLLDDDFDAITYTETRGPVTEVDSERKARDRLRARARIRPQSSKPIRYRGVAENHNCAASASEFEDHDDYRKNMNDMGKNSAEGVDLEMNTRRMKPREIGSAGRRILDIPQTRSERRDVNDRFGSPTARDDRGPGRGQNYKIINRRVLEDGPERTVTISTWRQEVARSVSPETPMSVYYVNADDYANDHGEDHTEGDMDNRARRGDMDDRNGRGGAGKGKEKPGVGVGWPFVEKRISPRRAISDRSFSPRSERIRSPSGSPEIKGNMPPRTVRSNRANTYDNPHTPPRGSTPGGERRASPVDLATDVPPRSSTPVRALPHPPTFHPTDSGSTISSIKATSLTSFENILSSCQPSLLHTAPVLEKLGIKNGEHLLAVGRLSEETRDREVREEALRMGLTVMEWAILLDKLQSL